MFQNNVRYPPWIPPYPAYAALLSHDTFLEKRTLLKEMLCTQCGYAEAFPSRR